LNRIKKSCCKSTVPAQVENAHAGEPPEYYSPQELNPNRRITRVWIEEGCVVCGACEVTAPKVFFVTDETSTLTVKAEEYYIDEKDRIEEAAWGCCVDVIKITYDTDVKKRGE
jgi:ferredoxin